MSLPVNVVFPPLVTLSKTNYYSIINNENEQYMFIMGLLWITYPPIPIINFILILFFVLGLRDRTLSKESLPRECFQSLSPFLSPRISLFLLFHWWTRFRLVYIGSSALRQGDVGVLPIRSLLVNQSALESSFKFAYWRRSTIAPVTVLLSAGRARGGARCRARAFPEGQLKSGNIPPNHANKHIVSV